MPTLHGVGILVTRPEQQAMPLCRLLEAEGAHTLRLPAIDIKPLGSRREIAAQLGPLAAFDAIIFSSANAVRFGAPVFVGPVFADLAGALDDATAKARERVVALATGPPSTGVA